MTERSVFRLEIVYNSRVTLVRIEGVDDTECRF